MKLSVCEKQQEMMIICVCVCAPIFFRAKFKGLINQGTCLKFVTKYDDYLTRRGFDVCVCVCVCVSKYLLVPSLKDE